MLKSVDTKKKKNTIVKSRVLTTRLLHSKIKSNNHKIKAFISASAVGYYGAQFSEKVFSETDPSYEDFMGNCCKQWEKATDLFIPISRVVKLRLGVILDPNFGALPKIAGMIKNRLGSPLGTGKQYMPWIHIQDAVELFYQAIISKQFSGIYNAVSNDIVTNAELTHRIGQVLNRKIWLPNVPSFLLKFLYGEMADTILKGVKVSNEKLKSTDFKFKYENLDQALREIYH